MNLRLTPFQAVGLASVSLIEPGAACPSSVRVVDLAVGLTVRRIASGPIDDTPSRPTTTTSDGPAPGAGGIDATRLDALIALVERGGDATSHECGGA